MSRKRHVSIVILLSATLTACGAHPSPTAPEDPFRDIALAPLPAEALAGSSVLLLPVGELLLTDSAARNADLVARRYTLKAVAEAALDSALRRQAPGVTWLGLAEQRRALRMAPALGIEPARLETGYLLSPKVESLADPLWSQVRTLMGMTDARTALAPAAVRLDWRGGRYVAEYVLVLVDPRGGKVLGRGRTRGAAEATPEAALRAGADATLPRRAP
jgi:hypothetical protein